MKKSVLFVCLILKCWITLQANEGQVQSLENQVHSLIDTLTRVKSIEAQNKTSLAQFKQSVETSEADAARILTADSALSNLNSACNNKTVGAGCDYQNVIGFKAEGVCINDSFAQPEGKVTSGAPCKVGLCQCLPREVKHAPPPKQEAYHGHSLLG